MEESEAATRIHIALVSIPAFSHQASILEFAKRLILHHSHFHVTCIIPTLSNSNTCSKSKPFFHALPPNIHCIFLPPINLEDDVDHSIPLEAQLSLSLSRSIPSIRQALKTLITSTNNNLVALVIDAMAHEALQFGKDFNVLSYIYFACSAMLLSLGLHSPTLDQTVPRGCEYSDFPQPIDIPGCISVRGSDLPNSLQDRSSFAYELYLRRCKSYLLADGILVNSFMEMEQGAITALSQQQQQQQDGTKKYPPVYAIGPIIQTTDSPVCDTVTYSDENPLMSTIGPIMRTADSSVHETPTYNNDKYAIIGQTDGSDCLLWLDSHPPNSVLYVSFGSGGTLSQDQINELALGLELSGHRFLWVNVMAPNDMATAAYLSYDNVGPLNFLPKGFLERTKGRGMVMPCWGPQIEILGHSAVSGFLTHCGWNSVLESVVKGVPMIAWPLFAEQRTNAAMVTDGLQVAVRVKSGGLVMKEEIAKLIQGLMQGLEGKEIRRRMEELKNVAACAVMEDGSSTKTLLNFGFQLEKLGNILEN